MSHCEESIDEYLTNRNELFRMFNISMKQAVPTISENELMVIFNRAFQNFEGEIREEFDKINLVTLESEIKKFYYNILLKHLELCLFSTNSIMDQDRTEILGIFKEKLDIC